MWCQMITAYVLIQTEVGKAGQATSAAAEIDGVHAYPLTQPDDVIVRGKARSIETRRRLVVSQLQTIDGVTHPLTWSVVDL
jgi:hypothetical protein